MTTAAAVAAVLPLGTVDHEALRERVRRLAEPRPGTYRMLDGLGRVIYVGKARRMRQRLLTYFRAEYPVDKAARILQAAHDIQWDYAPSEFSACLAELRLIRRHRPRFNVRHNRNRVLGFVRVTDEPAARVIVTTTPAEDGRHYGPFASPGRLREAARVLTDLLGLRDCAARMPMMFAEQGDLFAEPARAACPRFEFGTCLGPCAGHVTAADYSARVETAVAFLEGRTVQPMDRAIGGMQAAAKGERFELATRWRERFEALEWLLATSARARAALDLLTFVYKDTGSHGDDRAYLIRGGTVRATAPWPTTPIEYEAFQAQVRDDMERPLDQGPLPQDRIAVLHDGTDRHGRSPATCGTSGSSAPCSRRAAGRTTS